MATTTGQDDFSHLVDVLGSYPMIKRYIVLCLCFDLDTETASFHTSLEYVVRSALRKLKQGFPFLAGQVIYEGRAEGVSGIAKMVPLNDEIEFRINDLRNDPQLPTMAEMNKANFPMSMLDPNILLPPIAVSWDSDGFDKIAPVLILRANVIKGGVLLSFSGNHAVMDMTGLGMVVSLFSKACCNEPFTEQDIQKGNQDRRNAIPLLNDDYRPGDELDDLYARSSNEDRERVILASNPRWAYFNFRAQDLENLKEQASQQDIVPYVSTDDAISALCWLRTSQIRSLRLGDQIESTFCRVLSARRYLGLEGYMGHMVDCQYETEVDVHKRPLGEVAARLRNLLLQEDKIRYHMRAYATLLSRLADKNKLVNGAKLDVDRDLVVSSYTNVRCCETSFGPLLGVPDAARRPRMPAWPSLFYAMPKSKNGDIAVAFCASEEDMKRLMEDEVLAKYANYVG